MYFTFYTSSPFPDETDAAALEAQPLLPLPPTAKPATVHPSSPRALVFTLLLQLFAFTFGRFTSTARTVPAESLLILLALPSVIVPLVHKSTRDRLISLSPQASARLISLAIFLSLTLYAAFSSLALAPASVTLSFMSLAPLVALLLSTLILRARRALYPALASLLLLPCTALVAIRAPAAAPAISAAMVSSFSLAAFCLLASDAIHASVVAVASSAACGAIAIVFADSIALRSAASLSALNTAIAVAAFGYALIHLANHAPHWAATVSGIAAPLVAIASALLFSELPSVSATCGLVAGAAVSAVLANMRAVQQGFTGSANMLFTSSKQMHKASIVAI